MIKKCTINRNNDKEEKNNYKDKQKKRDKNKSE